ncbi:MAG TPA: SMP-30/gluconolactonase/LRE family protein [Caulobacteraceae bacterium]|nr:SMP-30/gluconolactonase/LRE family protein [Caulobacteraceae bacterium]
MTAAAAGATSAGAQTLPPLGETGDPMSEGALPLGPLSHHYPDLAVQTLDKRFPGVPGNAAIERVASGFRWAEGPAYFPAGRYLVFSDVANNRLLRLLEDDNHLSVFRQPSMNGNGNTVDREGRLITCEQGARRVTRTEHDGRLTVVAERCDGRRFNSPNDVTVASDGAIWFTDPTYGLASNYESVAGTKEQGSNAVYRVDPKSGQVAKVADGFDQPNGLCFSPDGRTLYVIDSGGPDNVRAFEVDPDSGRLGKSRVFIDKLGPGNTDGLRCDTAGNVWCSFGWGAAKEDGVRCYAPDGTLLGKINLPEPAANLTFGGALRNRLYVCASTSVYAVYVGAQGAA